MAGHSRSIKTWITRYYELAVKASKWFFDSDEPNQTFKDELIHLIDKLESLVDDTESIKSICLDSQNKFIESGFQEFTPINQLEYKNISLFIHLCGQSLTHINVEAYKNSNILPCINKHCPNLESLQLAIKIVDLKDFEESFLENKKEFTQLCLMWENNAYEIPASFSRSLINVAKTLVSLTLKYKLITNEMILNESFSGVLPRLDLVEKLEIDGFQLNSTIVKSIAKMRNLESLVLNIQQNNIISADLGKINTLKRFTCDTVINDKFLTNLSIHANKVEEIRINGQHITNNGIIALKKLDKLKLFTLGLSKVRYNNIEIDDSAISHLISQKLETLNLSGCINITNVAVIKMVNQLPLLETLSLHNTGINDTIVDDLIEMEPRKNHSLVVYISFGMSKASFDIARQLNITFIGPNYGDIVDPPPSPGSSSSSSGSTSSSSGSTSSSDSNSSPEDEVQ